MNNFQTPTDLLGQNAEWVKQMLVSVMRKNHNQFASAQEESRSRHALVYGAGWRDLTDEVAQVFKQAGFHTHRIKPAGYEIPIVNECLIYAWRKPESTRLSAFASSQTKRGLFDVPNWQQALFEPKTGRDDTDYRYEEELEIKDLLTNVNRNRPVIVVIRESTPQSLQSICWAIAEFDADEREVNYRGWETLWSPDLAHEELDLNEESFDSGLPESPLVEPRKEGRVGTDE